MPDPKAVAEHLIEESAAEHIENCGIGPDKCGDCTESISILVRFARQQIRERHA